MDKPVQKYVGIFIYPDAEVLDFSGPFEVFSTACRLRDSSEASLTPLLIAETLEPVQARGGFVVQPHYSISDHPELDILIVAGGVHLEVMERPSVQRWLQHQAHKVEILASVCTGVFLLAQAGVIHKQKVTTHWEDQDELKSRYPSLEVTSGQRWIDCPQNRPRLITSAGISAGIDMSLFILSLTDDLSLAKSTARQMEFDWQPPN